MALPGEVDRNQLEINQMKCPFLMRGERGEESREFGEVHLELICEPMNFSVSVDMSKNAHAKVRDD